LAILHLNMAKFLILAVFLCAFCTLSAPVLGQAVVIYQSPEEVGKIVPVASVEEKEEPKIMISTVKDEEVPQVTTQE